MSDFSKEIFDTIVVGGGPAGLSAAQHLSFHQRKVLVIDQRKGPLFFTHTPLWNVPGFLGQSGVLIQKEMINEAEKMGANIIKGTVVKISGSVENFDVLTEDEQVFKAKTILLATGVSREHPLVNGEQRGWFKWAARGNSYYCVDCESPEMIGKDIVVIGVGNPKGVIANAVSISEFAKSVRILLTKGLEFDEELRNKADSLGIEVTNGYIKEVIGDKGHIEMLILADDSVIKADGYYISGPRTPRNQLAKQLGLNLSEKGHIITGWRGQTNIEGVWAAGDIQPQTQQVTIAVGAGNIAAVMIDQFLMKKGLRALGKATTVL